MADARIWGKCSICGNPIHHDAIYYECSVSGCNKRRPPYRFCSFECWDTHQVDRNHRSAECIEERAPQN